MTGFLAASGIGIYADAAFSPLRALAARKSNSQSGLCTSVRRALHERLVWDELTYAAGFCINLRQHLCRKCRKCRSLKRLHAELLQTRKMSLKSGQP